MKKTNKKAGALSEMLILILAIVSFAYIIHQSSPVLKIVSAAGDAPETSSPIKCCEKTTNNSYCQEISDNNECQASSQLSPSLCKDTSFCKKGCCVNEYEGTYDKNTPKVLCSGNLKWVDDANCNLPGAELGCCVLKDRTYYITKQQCVRKTEQEGSGNFVDWKQNWNEALCAVADTITETKGACLLSEKTCKYTTAEECISLTGSAGSFFSNTLCTADELETVCKKTKETTCIEGKDEVYFLDSCGNPANIYDASRAEDNEYWQTPMPSGLSCSPLSGNANSKTCGNCNKFLGSSCSSAKENNFNAKYGEFYCKDISCKFQGKTYKSGESWCVYDGKIGDGDDIVGSRHWRYVCSQGEIEIEPCADYRNQICVQSETKDSQNKTIFTSASCRTNNWRQCIDLNSNYKGKLNKEGVEECEKMPDCMVKNITFADSFNFKLCFPKYPEGFSFDERGQDSAKSICGLGTKTCVIKYKSTPGGGCKCVDNCACDDAIFTQEMNDLCRKLGDCGLEINYAGNYNTKSPSYKVSGAPKLTQQFIKTILALINPKGNVPAEPDLKRITETIAGIPDLSNSPGAEGVALASDVALIYSEINNAVGEIESKSITGSVIGTGMPVAGAESLAGLVESGDFMIAPQSGLELGPLGANYEIANALAAILESNGITSLESGTLSLSTILPGGEPIPLTAGGFEFTTGIQGFEGLGAGAPPVAAFMNFAITLGASIVGGIIGNYLAKSLGLNSVGSFLMSMGMSILFTGIAAWAFNIPLPILDPLTFIIIGAVMVIISLFFGGGIMGDCPPKKVTFTCQPWEAPAGVSKSECEKCNNDELKPCSEYRCKSLGQNCELVNVGTVGEICTSGEDNGGFPVITPQAEIPNPFINVTYKEITSNGFKVTDINGKCLDAYTYFNFGINTDEISTCRFDISQKDFNDMEFTFAKSNGYNHTTSFFLPDPNHEKCGINWTGNLTLYIKCSDRFGHETPKFYTIDMCVNKGEDKTTPVIRALLPANNAFILYNATKQNVELYTNEPAECRWDLKDIDYSQMKNSFSCMNQCSDVTVLGFFCNATLLISSKENTFYLKCKDQPWLSGTDENKRNANQESLKYTLKKADSELKIERYAPKGSFKSETELSTIQLQVKTSGGAENPICYYSFSGFDRMIAFYETASDVHRQEFQLLPGEYKVYIRCIDSAGDSAREEAEFEIIHDTFPPGIARIYILGSSLKIITTEDAECVYSTKSCRYNFEDGISAGDGTEHSIPADEKTYYIKCRDEFKNLPSGCSVIAKPIEFSV